MKTFSRGLALGLVLPLCCLSWCIPLAVGTEQKQGRNHEKSGDKNAVEKKTGDILLATMQRELQRATPNWTSDPAPYFASYSVYDQEGTVVVGGLGSLLNSTNFVAGLAK